MFAVVNRLGHGWLIAPNKQRKRLVAWGRAVSQNIAYGLRVAHAVVNAAVN